MKAAESVCACGAVNSGLALRCTACGAYLRDRVPTLDLFSTLWGVVETPGTAFVRVARSEQKNYTHLLFASSGPLLLALAFSLSRAGDRGWSFVELLALIVFTGPLLGLLTGVTTALLLRLLMRMRNGGRFRYRDVAAGLAWAMSPLGWISAVILPLQLGLFGNTLFSLNPAAWHIQPLPYWILLGIEAAALVWMLVLLSRCMQPHGDSGRFRLFPPLLLTLTIVIVLSAASFLTISKL